MAAVRIGNVIFITVLCIVYDNKSIKSPHNHEAK